MYKSINSLIGRSQSRRDDLESLAYVLVRLRTGNLPWYNFLKDNKISKLKTKRKILIECKKRPAHEICKGICKEFKIFLEEVRNLSFTAKPDYDKYYKMFERLLKRKGFTANVPLVWS